MKLVTFTENNRTRIGILKNDSVIDLSAEDPGLPDDMLSFLEAGDDALAGAVKVSDRTAAGLSLESVKLEAPVPNPGKILAIGLNYADHVAESGMELPGHQIWFNKQCTSIAGPEDEILIPAVAPNFIDYEAELCMVIGKRCRHVPADRASEVIFGFTCGNDVSVRDWQMRTPQFTLGKSFASHAPIGPWIVTADEFGDPHNKTIACYVNDERRQESNTQHLIFNCYEQIAELTAAFELRPGDIIFTGTPDGVGAAMKPPQFLASGDRVRVDIEGVGSLESVFANEVLTTIID